MGHRPRPAAGPDRPPVRRLDIATADGAAVTYLTATTHGYLWYVDADTYGFKLDDRHDGHQSRCAAVRHLFQTGPSGARFDIHVDPDLHGQLHADLAWAAQAPDDDRDALSIRTLRRWLHDGQLTLTVDAHLPDRAAAYAAHAGELQARHGGNWSDTANPQIDHPTASQLRDRAAAQGRTIVYTDGSVQLDKLTDGRRRGGWAWWVDGDHHDAGPIQHAAYGVIGAEADAMAQAATYAPGDRLLLVTDALWVLQMLAGTRGDPEGIVARLLPILATRDIELAWLPGHSDPLGHNLADRLANRARVDANVLR